MLNTIKNWILSKFHIHEYEIIQKATVNVYEDDSDRYPIRKHVTYTQKCKICNHIRSYRVNL